VGVGRCEVTTEKFGDLAKELITSEGITDEATLNDPDSYQAAAFKWLVEEDTYALSCPQDPNPECLIIQRYVLATLYFGTNGNNWTDCGANGIDFEPDSCEASVNGAYSPGGNTTWLSRVNECAWGLLACVPETGCVDRIEMGTFYVILSHEVVLFSGRMDLSPQSLVTHDLIFISALFSFPPMCREKQCCWNHPF
jgi:hypothetical protein